MTRRQRITGVCVGIVTVVIMVVDAFTSMRWLGGLSGLGLVTMSLIGLFAPFDGPPGDDTRPRHRYRP